MNILIFAGSTISGQEILQHLDAILLPPPAQGDILTSLDQYRPQAIGIIDTAFPRSAWVSEAHFALRSGVAVYGAGAQGALRAVELQDYGMKGCGKVFHDFATGEHSDDAAVLCRYTEQNGLFVKTSESLVNVLATLKSAYTSGILNETEFDRLCLKSQEVYWRERSWQHILLPDLFTEPRRYEEACDWLKKNQVDLQKQDAIELLQAIANDKDQLRHNIYVPADRLGMLEHMYRRECKAQRDSGSVPFFSIAHHAAINHTKPLEVNFSGLNRDIVAFFAERMELQPTENELDYEWTIFKHERSLDEEGLKQWCHENDMTPEAMDELIKKNALCRKMHQWMIMKRGLGRATGPFLDELKIRGEYPKYAESAARIESSKEKHKEKYQIDFCRFSFEEILAMREKMKKKPMPWPVPYNQASRVMGITKDELFCELRRETFHEEQAITDIIDTLYDKQ